MELNEEVRDGHLVTAETKKLWAVQLDLLDRLEKICKKHGLKYYADGGTLLGAVRHKGFIPWDDDIDVQMFVDDFEAFCRFAKEELEPPYFLQYWNTEKGFYPWHAKLRRSDTTCFSQWELEMSPGGNHGIFIDIFPLYNIPDSAAKYKWQTIRLKALQYMFKCFETDRALKNSSVKATATRRAASGLWKLISLFTSSDKICRRYLSVAKCEKGRTKKVGVTSYTPGYAKYTWDRALFEKTVDLPFEDRTISAPYKYEERLTVQYGDWKKIVKNAANHSALHFSADIPYKDYLKKQK
ncbi:MAG: LicD family protein [Ruminococcus sp.]|uniref:LicD family protein n=1 Tax=Ruminococcus sp. TaxID=41978 RepID=UPI0025D785A1|nr:LicD family protein [Ruminococcus sp.]MBR5683120.1 LicD family protein [Ruminococcus sp.]